MRSGNCAFQSLRDHRAFLPAPRASSQRPLTPAFAPASIPAPGAICPSLRPPSLRTGRGPLQRRSVVSPATRCPLHRILEARLRGRGAPWPRQRCSSQRSCPFLARFPARSPFRQRAARRGSSARPPPAATPPLGLGARGASVSRGQPPWPPAKRALHPRRACRWRHRRSSRPWRRGRARPRQAP